MWVKSLNNLTQAWNGGVTIPQCNLSRSPCAFYFKNKTKFAARWWDTAACISNRTWLRRVSLVFLLEKGCSKAFQDMISISCLTPMSPVMKFTIRTLLVGRACGLREYQYDSVWSNRLKRSEIELSAESLAARQVLLFFVVAAIVHFIYLLCKRAQTLKISLLLRTVGNFLKTETHVQIAVPDIFASVDQREQSYSSRGHFVFHGFLRKLWPERFPYFRIVELQALSFFASGTLFMAFFISLCSSLLLPFRCNVHPNGRWTVQTYHEAWDDKHSRALCRKFLWFT